MPTIVDLGQKVKAKYPGQYDNLDDAEVGRRVKAKYPQYSGFSDSVPFEQQTPAQQIRSQARAKSSLTGREAPTPSIPAQLADLTEGTGKYMSGALLPAAVLNPVATVGALAGGALADTAVNAGSQLAGADPDTARLMGDIASVPGAMLGESPRLGGYVKGGLREVLPSIWRGGLKHLFLPNPADITAAATEGAKGRLWSGPMNRLLLQPPTGTPESPAGAPTLTRFDLSQYGPAPSRIAPVDVGGGHIPDLIEPIPGPSTETAPPETADYAPTQSRFSVSQYGPAPSRIAPVEVGGGHVPDLVQPISRPMPGQPPPLPAAAANYTPTQGRFSVSQYGPAPSRIAPVDVGGGHIPDLVQPISRPMPGQPPPLPVAPAAQPSIQSRFSVSQYNAPVAVPPPVEVGGGHIPDFDFSASSGQLSPEEVMRRISAKNVQEFTGSKVQKAAAKSGKLEATQANKAVVIPSQSLASSVVNPLESVVAPTPLTPPVTPTPAPAPPSGILQNLIKTVQASPDTNAETIAEHAGHIGHNLTTSKNSVIANHLLGQGLTPEAWDALPMDQKNAWVKKVNVAQKKSYKPFGADFGPGRYGRPADEAARQVGDAMRVLGAKPPQ